MDTQPFHVNIIELASKKFWFGQKWPIKAKAKTSLLVILTRRISKEGLLRKLRIGRLTSPKALGQAQSSSQAKLPNSSIADDPAPMRGRCGAQANGPTDSVGQFAHGQRRWPPHKAKKRRKGKTRITHMVGWTKVSPNFDQLLSKYGSKKVVLRDRPTKNPVIR
jgi:hypothetical protein